MIQLGGLANKHGKEQIRHTHTTLHDIHARTQLAHPHTLLGLRKPPGTSAVPSWKNKPGFRVRYFCTRICDFADATCRGALPMYSAPMVWCLWERLTSRIRGKILRFEIHPHTRTHTRTRTHAHKHACTHANAQTHTHTHRHTRCTSW